MNMKDKIIVALDVPTREEALRLVDKLYQYVGAFKIGMQLYNSEGPDIVRDIKDCGGKVFVDLKFHDIPNTVAQAAKVITGRGAFMFTLHASGGFKMMQTCAEAAKNTAAEKGIEKPLAVAVTVLTSISQEEFQEEIGIQRPIAEQVVYWAKMAQRAGLDGVVASPKELAPIREACGQDFVIVTPGIRPAWAAVNDQSRIMTPRQAVEAGASYLVIGRPITSHQDPAEAAKRIGDEMAEAKISF